MMHLLDPGWKPIRKAKHEVIVLALTVDATTSDGAITAGSVSSSITVVTANGGAATGPTSGGAPSPGGR